MSMFSFLGRRDIGAACELPDIYPLSLMSETFVKADLEATYSKILTDTLERTSGIPPEVQPALWDNCLVGEAADGLVTLLVGAMVAKSELFLVYVKSTKTLRKATGEETQKIREDYKAKGESPIGVFVSFQKYRRTDMLKIYAALEYCILSSLHKSVNIAKAVQLKMNGMRSGVSLADAGVATTQAQAIANALRAGKDVMIDAEDDITNATPDVSPTEKAIQFLNAKRAYILNLPLSYIAGEQTTGIGSTGEADMRAVERGLKEFYFSVIKPVTEALFGVKTIFKSQDFRQITSALEILKAFELVGDSDLISLETMREIVAAFLNLDAKQEAKRLENQEPRDSQNTEADSGFSAEAI